MSFIKHGHASGGKSSRTYTSWYSMLYRCRNPNADKYYMYGAVGVSVCERWTNSFEDFLADMGERPENTTLDRFPDKNGNYEPGNCRWATIVQQNRNRTLSNKKNIAKYTGVYMAQKKTPNSPDRWVAQIRVQNKTIHLGRFKSPEEAALAFNKKAKEVYGDNACLNHVPE